MGQFARLLDAVTVPDRDPGATAPVVEVDFGKAVALYYEGEPPAGTTYDAAVNAITHALREELGPTATSFRLIHPKLAAAGDGVDEKPAGGIGTVGPEVQIDGATGGA